MMAYISRLTMLQKAIRENPKAIIITERCLLTDYHIFAKLLYENKSMLQEEYEIYKTWFHSFQDIQVDGIIYVRTDASVAFERCKLRSRPGETIDEAYLKQCHEKHEEWIQEEYDLIIDNNITEQEEALWMIHDYISDVVWEHKDPTPYDYTLMYIIVIWILINTLSFQKSNLFHSRLYRI
jgi:deoxyadenosine/deoxycytidine kinase